MSNQNAQFCFVPEEQPSIGSDRESEEKFPFFLRMVCLCVLCLGPGVWFVSNRFNKNLESNRTIQSRQISSVSTQQAVDLDIFFVFLKSGTGVQLTKVEVVLQVNHSEVLKEIQTSLSKIRDHLVFILSKKDVSVFSDLEKRQFLEKEIVAQLNLFLIAGKIENVQLKETFLN